MSRTLRIAIAGAGLIGRQHAVRVQAHPHMSLTHVVDPFLDARDDSFGAETRIVDSLTGVLGTVDGIILATPNALHAAGAITALEAGVPVLVEKPIADTVEAAERILSTSLSTGVPVLVGHHRRHSPLLAAAVDAIAAGTIGTPVAVMGSALFRKPDDYFEAAPWRTRTGGGPILINLIHDIDNLRALCGDITSVQATASNKTRGFEVEDTAAITLTFASGALGTFIVSDAAASVRSWEQTSAENPSYDFAPDEDCYHIAGTRGSISIPTLRIRSYTGEPSWWETSQGHSLPVVREDPLDAQLEHFGRVILGTEEPRVSALDGLQSLRVINAISRSLATGAPEPVQVSAVLTGPEPQPR